MVKQIGLRRVWNNWGSDVFAQNSSRGDVWLIQLFALGAAVYQRGCCVLSGLPLRKTQDVYRVEDI